MLPGENAMATAGISARNLPDAEHSARSRRAVVASTVGSVIESYDFLLYVLIAPLVFAKLYFPSSDPLVGTLQAFGIYAVGLISRPLGAAFFGHYGDRIGRPESGGDERRPGAQDNRSPARAGNRREGFGGGRRLRILRQGEA
jgi:MFS family permease